MKENNVHKEAAKKNQTQLRSPRRNIVDEKKIDNQAKKQGKTQCSKSAFKVSSRRDVVGERRKKHDQS